MKNISNSFPCRKAFSLAEILITIGILGVVSALTLPSLINKYQEKQLVTSYLRVYSILENAYKSVQNEYDTFENWSGAEIGVGKLNKKPEPEKVYEYMIKPYIEVNQVFLPKDSNWSSTGTTTCFPEKFSYFNNVPGDILSNRPAVSLKSGECLIFGYNNYSPFVVDLNSKRKPNVMGKDIFIFSFDPVKPERIKPGYPEAGWTDTPNYCDKSSAHGWIAGISCGFWIVRYKNMDYLHLPFEQVKSMWHGWVW